MNVEKETCHRMMYFLSASPNVYIVNRPKLKEIIELIFPSKNHNATSRLLDKHISTGSSVNLDLDLFNIRKQSLEESDPNNQNESDLDRKNLNDMFLYVWCPYLEVNPNPEEVKEYDFKLSFVTNENEIDPEKIYNYSAELENKIRNINLGELVIDSSLSHYNDVYEKVKNVILSSENGEALLENVQNLAKNNHGVMEVEIDVTGKLVANDEFKVQTVN